jgi:ribosomal protein S27E
LLEHGFLRAKCEGCRHEHLVAFSCCPQPETMCSSYSWRPLNKRLGRWMRRV